VFSCHDSDDLTAETIIENLAAAIDGSSVSRFNVSRTNIWDGASRAIRRKNFSAQSSVCVKFTDDVGNPEGAIDHGGPRREFLSLMMEHLSSESALFFGPPNCRHLNYISSGMYRLNNSTTSVMGN